MNFWVNFKSISSAWRCYTSQKVSMQNVSRMTNQRECADLSLANVLFVTYYSFFTNKLLGKVRGVRRKRVGLCLVDLQIIFLGTFPLFDLNINVTQTLLYSQTEVGTLDGISAEARLRGWLIVRVHSWRTAHSTLGQSQLVPGFPQPHWFAESQAKSFLDIFEI